MVTSQDSMRLPEALKKGVRNSGQTEFWRRGKNAPLQWDESEFLQEWDGWRRHVFRMDCWGKYVTVDW
jgi:hypothetical protein